MKRVKVRESKRERKEEEEEIGESGGVIEVHLGENEERIRYKPKRYDTQDERGKEERERRERERERKVQGKATWWCK